MIIYCAETCFNVCTKSQDMIIYEIKSYPNGESYELAIYD